MDIELPVVAAPMAGGPSTPALVLAAVRVGGLGFLAGGYRTPQALIEDIAAVRPAGRGRFGVNLFAPNPVRIDPASYARYADLLAGEAQRYGVALPAYPVEDDDHWPDKVDLLLADPVPVVSFTFGIPPRSVFAAFRRVGTRTVQTVTSVEEANAAAEAGADELVVQSAAAGGHWGTLTPTRPPATICLPDLVAGVRRSVGLPLIATGGLADPGQVAAVLSAGAGAVMVGTALLRADEAGTSPVHRAVLADHGGRTTIVTRAFTGRPARALRNRFTDRFSESAPIGYPALHHLTGPVRRAAAKAGDPESVHLWAGTGFRSTAAGPAADILERLVGRG